MSPLVSIALSLGVFLATAWLTGRVRRYALARRVLDVPNVRSSHSMVTPRGGGVAIALTTLSAFVLLGWLGLLTWRHVFGLLAGGALVTAIGFADDRRYVARRWRLLGHVVAAAAVLVGLGGVPPLPVLGATVDLGWLGPALAALYVVWLINLTNFMDGIDGIAGIEAIIVSAGGALLYYLAARAGSAWAAPLVVAAAAFGFLVWNWPPAKIFMGDSGSGFLGLMLAALSLQSAWVMPAFFWSWVILLGAFIVDATVTLVRRTIRGDRIYEAHRMHAYQHAARRCGAHKPVSLAVAAITLVWLLPIALLVAMTTLDGLVGVLVAYAPLVAAAVRLGAGVPQPSSA